MSSITKLVLPTPFRVGPVNTYIIKADAVTLVDTGPKVMDTWKELLKQLEHHGLRIQNIDQIVLTHQHTDHVGLVNEIKQIKDIPVYSHHNSIPYLVRDPAFTAMREQFFTDLYSLHGVSHELLIKLKETENYLRKFDEPIDVDGLIEEGDPLPGSDGWTVIETPGHSPDHLSLYDRTHARLIGGDHIIAHISSNAFVEPLYGTLERPKALVVYQQALARLLELPISTVYAGHGEEIYDVHTLINNRIRKQEERAQQLYSMLEPSLSAFALSEKLFPHLYVKELPLTMSEVIGHIDLLVERGKLKVEREEHRFVYHKIN